MKKLTRILALALVLALTLSAFGTNAVAEAAGLTGNALTAVKGAKISFEDEKPADGDTEDPYLNDGTITGLYLLYEAMGIPVSIFAIFMDMDTEEAEQYFQVMLNEDGTAYVIADGERADITYTLEGEKLTLELEVDGEKLEGTLKDGLMTIEMDGDAITLARKAGESFIDPTTVINPEEFINDGTITGTYHMYKVMGITLAQYAALAGITAEEASKLLELELRDDGTATIKNEKETLELTYSVEGEVLTLTGIDEDALIANIKDGLITVNVEGVEFIMARLTEAAYGVSGDEPPAELYINDGTVAGSYLLYSVKGMNLHEYAALMELTVEETANLVQIELTDDGKAFVRMDNEAIEMPYVLDGESIKIGEGEDELSGTLSGGLLTFELEGWQIVMARLTEAAFKEPAGEPETEPELYINDGTIPGNYRLYNYLGMSVFELAELLLKTPEEMANQVRIELFEDGSMIVYMGEEGTKGTYTAENGVITMTVEGDDQIATLEDGLLTMESEGVQIVLARLTDAAFVVEEKGEAVLWTGVYTKMVGSDKKNTDEEFSLELYADGTGVHHRDGFDINMTWSQEGDTFTMTETFGGLVYTGTMEGDELHLFNGDPDDIWTFEYVYGK